MDFFETLISSVFFADRKRTGPDRSDIRGAEASPRPPKKKSEVPSGSIRDITAHLIHDKNTSIEVSCTVFNFPSAGNDPGWIYWSYEFLFFRPRGLGGPWDVPGPARARPRASQGQAKGQPRARPRASQGPGQRPGRAMPRASQGPGHAKGHSWIWTLSGHE